MNKQIEEMRKELIEIFDEEYEKRRIITPNFTAEKMTAKGYRRQDEVAREIFAEIEQAIFAHGTKYAMKRLEELKKKYEVTDE